jgi:hypothetical protein
MIEPPPRVRHRFVDAGWFPGRAVSVPPSVPSDHPAWVVLAAVGGLSVGACGAGEECATSDLRFSALEPDPAVTEVWGPLLGTQLVGIAEVHHAHGELYIDTAGRCFGSSCIHDAFYFEGESFAEAVERLLLGRRSRPMLRPDRVAATLYGIRLTDESP